MGALSKGNHRQYLDNPSNLGGSSAVTDGNGILGHVLGSKDVSRAVAGKAASQTGLSADVLKKLLPLAATAMMGAFAKQQAAPSASATSGGGIMSMLSPLLDRDRDGSIMDDVTSMLGKFMKQATSSPVPDTGTPHWPAASEAATGNRARTDAGSRRGYTGTARATWPR